MSMVDPLGPNLFVPPLKEEPEVANKKPVEIKLPERPPVAPSSLSDTGDVGSLHSLDGVAMDEPQGERSRGAAMIIRNNPYISYFLNKTYGVDNTHEPGYSAQEQLDKMHPDSLEVMNRDRFYEVRNPDMFRAMQNQLQEEKKNKELEDSAGLMEQILVGGVLAGGVMDPLQIALPGGITMRAAKGGVSLTRTALMSSASGVVSTGIQEAMLHGSQELRTVEESIANMGGAALIVGVLGTGGAAMLRAAERTSITNILRKQDEANKWSQFSDMRAVMPYRSPEDIADAQRIFEDLKPKVREALPNLTDEQVNRSVAVQSLMFATVGRRIDPTGAGAAWNFYDTRMPYLNPSEWERLGTNGSAASYDQLTLYHGSPHDFPAVAEVVFRDGRPNMMIPLGQKLDPALVHAIEAGDVSIVEHPLGKFDIRKIGTGEGVQVYGHGLYFAENPAVAREYKEKLGRAGFKPKYTLDNVVAPDHMQSAIWSLVHSNPIGLGTKFTATPEMIQRAKVQHLRRMGVPEGATEYLTPFDFISGKTVGVERPPGKMYEVNINAKPEQFLDWDKPVEQMGGDSVRALREVSRRMERPYLYPGMTGEQIYKDIELSLPGVEKMGGSFIDRVGSSAVLKDAGILGIKYLDQGSRFDPIKVAKQIDDLIAMQVMAKGDDATIARLQRQIDSLRAKEQTSNFVMFSDEGITITRKWQKTAEGEAQGRITFSDGRPYIELFERADVTTLQHEMAHFWLDTFEKLAKTSEGVADDFNKIKAWLGVDDASKIGTAEHEKFARGYERYLAEGVAPTRELGSIFGRFREWMADIYKSFDDLGAKPPQEVTDAFDRMLATPDEIAATKKYLADHPNDPRAHSLSAAEMGGLNADDVNTYGTTARWVSKLMAWTTPAERIYNNPIPFVTEAGTKVINALRYMGMHDEGRTVGRNIEKGMFYWKNLMTQVQEKYLEEFKKYTKTEAYKSTGYNIQEFRSQVSWAAIHNDEHVIPEIAAAAKFRRAEFLDKIKDRQLANGLIDAEDIAWAAQTSASHNHRVWNGQLIEANPEAFMKMISDEYQKIFVKEHAESLRNLQALLARYDQETSDMHLSPEMRAKTLVQLDNEKLSLVENNYEEAWLHRQIADLRSEQRAKSRDLDPEDKKAVAEEYQSKIKVLQDKGGHKLREYTRTLETINSRRRSVDFGEAGLSERYDKLLEQLYDNDEANMVSMERLIRRGQRLEKELTSLSEAKLAEQIDDITKTFSDTARRAERSAERAKTQIENTKALIDKADEREKQLRERGKAEEADAMAARRRDAEAKMEKRAAEELVYQTELAERMNKTAERLRLARDVDDQAALDELKDAITKLTNETSSLSMRRGARAASIGERMANLTPERLVERATKIAEMRADAEAKFRETWEVQRLGDGVGTDTPNFKDAADEVALEIYRKVTGVHHDADAPKVVATTARGSSRNRTVMISDEKLFPWLIQDAATIDQRLARVVGGDIEFSEVLGKTNMTETLAKIDDEYRKKIEAVRADNERLPEDLRRSEKAIEAEIKWLRKWREWTVKDFQELAKLVREDYTTGFMNVNLERASYALRGMAYIMKMGGVVLSNLTELPRLAFVHGFGNAFETASGGLANLERLKAVHSELMPAHGAMARIGAVDALRMTDMWDTAPSKDKFSSLVERATDIGSLWNGMKLWESKIRRFSVAMINNRMGRAIMDYDNISDLDKRWLAMTGIDEARANSLRKLFQKHGSDEDGLFLANIKDWDWKTLTDNEKLGKEQIYNLQRDYFGALTTDLTSTVVRRSVGDMPLFANTWWGKLAFQFNTFNVAAHQRLLMRGLQEDQLRFAMTILSFASMGMMMEYAKAAYSGRLERLPPMNENIGWWLNAGLNNSGIFTLAYMANNMMDRSFGYDPLKSGLTSLFNDVGTQYTVRPRAEPQLFNLAGPAVGNIQTATRGIHRAVKDQMEGMPVSDSAKLNIYNGLVPYQNYIGLNYLSQQLTRSWRGE